MWFEVKFIGGGGRFVVISCNDLLDPLHVVRREVEVADCIWGTGLKKGVLDRVWREEVRDGSVLRGEAARQGGEGVRRVILEVEDGGFDNGVDIGGRG